MSMHDQIKAALDPSTGYRDLDDRAREWLAALLDEVEAQALEIERMRTAMPTETERALIVRYATTRDADYDATLTIDPGIARWLARLDAARKEAGE